MVARHSVQEQGQSLLRSGQIVHVPDSAAVVGFPFDCVTGLVPPDYDRLRLLPVKALLPMVELLRRQPVLDFWALLHRRRMLDRHRDYCLASAEKQTLGPHPHRFESEGECLYYIRHYGLAFGEFLMIHAQELAITTT
jgi:hypothetical protein